MKKIRLSLSINGNTYRFWEINKNKIDSIIKIDHDTDDQNMASSLIFWILSDLEPLEAWFWWANSKN